MDGNGSHEVIVANNKALVIINGSDGEVLQTVGLGGRARTVRSTPTIADIDQDGKLDVVIGISRLSDGAVAVAFSGFDSSGDLALNSPDGIHPAYSAPWPMHRGNNRRDGVYRD